ncbi:hypothetical protein [Streptacidiphilus sp. MAP5-3]|uniref:hypothetical protein n=1 Tax=unclassified Streptacidiphilus TaxID=2643834 RepID=UPI0035186D1C
MKKVIALAVLTTAGLALAAPAHADDGANSPQSNGFKAAVTCLPDLVLSPVTGPTAAGHCVRQQIFGHDG